MTNSDCSVRAIIGPGRSGTTWAGTLIDSCPDVIYRFEPFHRMAPVSPAFREYFLALREQRVSEEQIPELYALLRKAHPLTNKAPFFAQKSYRQLRFGRNTLWPVVRMLQPIAPLYSALLPLRPP